MGSVKANLFVVGAMKAGTTSFMEVLSQHSEIYVSPIKEPNYFVTDLPKLLYEPSRFFSIENYFQKNFPASLHITKLEKLTHYQKLFSLQKGEKHLAEGSTLYLHAPEVAQKIYDYNPDAKIIIVTRNPLQRSFSHYRMLVGLSRETREFQEIVENEIVDYEKGNLPWHSYIGMSFYKYPIDRYTSLFKNVCILSFEDLLKDRETTFKKLASFLEIESFPDFEVGNINPTRNLRFKKMFFLLKKIGLKDYFSAIFGSNFKRKLFKMASKNESQPIQLSKETL